MPRAAASKNQRRRRKGSEADRVKGGYQAQSRLESTLDEIRMEAQVAAGELSIETMRRAFAEIGRLTVEAKRFADYITGGPQPLGYAGA